ncbi:hypothetical protein CTRI78_v004962 [Colletotrichum trifolii]|uniref:DUF6546 domain-containing protein n=1 Tax=Colletotrichum trifolii TaxID=5466 RepID=A0A4R8RG41_COLTR|nr:hypothetical protein CTRI78_v004962 [Colletotrichum trifolii]
MDANPSIPQAASPGAWRSLPTELGLQVLEELYTLSDEANRSRRRSELATVCEEWRDFFWAKANYTLTLKDQDLPLFNSYTRGRQPYHSATINLRIGLKPYTCDFCDQEENDYTIAANNKIFTESAYRVLSTLSTWQSAHCVHLQIVVRSPSDYEHGFGFRDCPKHTVQAQSRRFDREGSCSRVIGSLLDIDMKHLRHLCGPHVPRPCFPQAPAVDFFSLGARNSARGCSASAHEKLMASLPGLTFLRLKSRRIQGAHQYGLRRGARRALLHHLPRGLSEIEWIEAERFHGDDQAGYGLCDEDLIQSLTQLSRTIQRLALEVGSPGLHFARLARNPSGGTWPQMQLLTFIVNGLHDATEMDRSLVHLGEAAMLMPKLRRFECGFRSAETSCDLQYMVKDDAATLLIITLNFKVSESVQRTWEKVAERNTAHVLQVERVDGEQGVQALRRADKKFQNMRIIRKDY